jgi:hypothetical protein
MGGDILFETVERYHAGRPFGRVLDAGTGVSSVKWLMSLSSCTAWTAITADDRMKENVMNSEGIELREGVDELVVGNWMDEEFCKNLGTYDTILADYLFGAVDGFSPYAQDIIFKKLKEHLNPNGRLYIIGMYPIPDHAAGDAEIICEIKRARDACILLAGHRPYREYPIEWVLRHLHLEGFAVLKSRSFTILHSKESAVRQIRVARSKLDLLPPSLKKNMQMYLADLESRTNVAMERSARGNIPLSNDYVIAAELPGADGKVSTVDVKEDDHMDTEGMKEGGNEEGETSAAYSVLQFQNKA